MNGFGRRRGGGKGEEEGHTSKRAASAMGVSRGGVVRFHNRAPISIMQDISDRGPLRALRRDFVIVGQWTMATFHQDIFRTQALHTLGHGHDVGKRVYVVWGRETGVLQQKARFGDVGG